MAAEPGDRRPRVLGPAGSPAAPGAARDARRGRALQLLRGARRQARATAGDGLASIFYVANWRFIASGQSYFDLFSGVSPLRHLWSLAIEEQFYLLWPLVFIAIVKLSKGSTRVLAGVTIGGIALSVLTIGAQYEAVDPSRAYYGTDGRAHTLLVGCLLAILLPHLMPRTPRAQAAVQGAGLLAALFSLVVITQVTDHSVGYYRGGSLLFAVGVAAMILASIQPGRSPIGSFMSFAPLRWTGLISYGLYLWHWPINTFMTEGRVGVSGDMLNLLRLFVTFLVAIASYYLVENPIRRGMIGRRTARAVTPAAVAFVTVAFLTATATAATPPDYLGGAKGWRFACDAPSAELQAQADEGGRANRLAEPPPGMPAHVMVVGDSVACSLSLGLRTIGGPLGMTLNEASVIGCGAATGQVYLPDEEIPQTTEQCPPLVHDRITAAAAQPTDAVVWFSSWERADQVVDGKLVEFDSSEGRKLLAVQLEDTYQLIRSGTPAPIYLLTTSAPGPGNYQDGERRGARSNDVRFTELNRRLAGFARRHPADVHLIDLDARDLPGRPAVRHAAQRLQPARRRRRALLGRGHQLGGTLAHPEALERAVSGRKLSGRDRRVMLLLRSGTSGCHCRSRSCSSSTTRTSTRSTGWGGGGASGSR